MFQLNRILENGLDHLYRLMSTVDILIESIIAEDSFPFLLDPLRELLLLSLNWLWVEKEICKWSINRFFSSTVFRASINIQRGRDHGLQPYNHYRKLCNLKTLQRFDEVGQSHSSSLHYFSGRKWVILKWERESPSCILPLVSCVIP